VPWAAATALAIGYWPSGTCFSSCGCIATRACSRRAPQSATTTKGEAMPRRSPPCAYRTKLQRSCAWHASAHHGALPFSPQVRFSYNDRYILSAGGEDLAIFVWRVRVRGGGSAGAVAAARAAAARTSRMAVTATTAPSAETGATAEGAVAGVGVGSGVSVVSASWAAAAEDDVFEEEGEEDDEDDSDVEPDERLAMKLKMKGGQMGGAVTGAGEGGEGGGDDDDDDDDDDEVFVAAEAMGGEQILSIQPWRAAAVAPSRAPSELELAASSQPPDATLELEWVYGKCL